MKRVKEITYYSYSKMVMIFYFDKKELKLFKVEEKATIHKKDCQFVIHCKDINVAMLLLVTHCYSIIVAVL